MKYLALVKTLESGFNYIQGIKIPRGQNNKNDRLSKGSHQALKETSAASSVDRIMVLDYQAHRVTDWRTQILRYLNIGVLEGSPVEQKKLRSQASRLTIID